MIVTTLLGQSGGNLFAQPQTIYVNSLDQLHEAFNIIASLNGTNIVNVEILKTIDMDETSLKLTVPSGVTVNIIGGTIHGHNQFSGMVITTADTTAIVNINGTVFQNCVSSGTGTDAGLGGALSIHGEMDTVTLTDVTFKNDKGGGGIFLDGTNVVFDDSGSNYTVSGNISDISAKAGFNKWEKDSNGDYILLTSRGDVRISDGSTVTLTGNNNYAGVTTIGNGATLIADGAALKDVNGKNLTDVFGKTVHNAVGNLSEVQIGTGGTLELKQSETIGFLSGAGTVQLNGKMLVISGDEDPDHFGKGYNPATGNIVGDFSGTIVNNTAGAELIKSGTGRLTLGSDNTTTEVFTTTIYQGTIVLGDAKALGDGNVTVRNIDTGTRDRLRNIIEAGSDLKGADAVMNNFKIETSGKNLDGVQKNFNAFVVGGGYDIQFGQAGIEGGQLTGGNLLINMDDELNKVFLANDGYDSTTSDYSDAKVNKYNETQIYKGTVVVYENGGTLAGTTLGNGSVRAVGFAGNAILSAADDGMTIKNNLVMDFGSALTLANEGAGVSYSVTGSTGGQGGLNVALADVADKVALQGTIGHTGATKIARGILEIDPTIARSSTTLYNLSSSDGGTLDVKQGNLTADISGSNIVYSGQIIMSGGGTLTKTGAGTWVFDNGIVPVIDSITVNAGALKLSADGTVDNAALAGSGQLIIDTNVTLTGLSAQSTSNNVTVNGTNTLTLDAASPLFLTNTWTGGPGATVVFGNDTTLNNLYQYSASWEGTMEIADHMTLTVKSPGGLGKENAQVTLNNGSTLVIDTYQTGYYSLFKDQIGQLNITGDSTVQVNPYNEFITGTLNGGDDVTKTGLGTWTMLESSSGFSGDVHLDAGTLYLSGTAGLYDSDWGSGTLNVTGNAGLLIDTDGTGRTVDGEINIDAGGTMNFGIVQKEKTHGEVVLTGDITGVGDVNYFGAGTLVYGDTAKSYTGNTNIADGTLRVEIDTETSYFVNKDGTLNLQNVDLNSGNVTVHSGGTLNGTGATTAGDMVFESGSRLVADYATGTDPLFIANQVTINDGAVAHIAANTAWVGDKTLVSGTPTTGDMFWFTNTIQGQRTVGEWDGSDLKIRFVDFDYEDHITAANADMMVPYLYAIVDNTAPPVMTRSGPIPINTPTSNLLKALENVNPNQYNYALLETGGQINASLVTAQMQTTTGMFPSVAKQLYPVGYFTEPCEEGYATSGGTIYRGQSVRSGWTGWSSGLGAFGTTKSYADRGTYGYDYSSFGMSVGIEPTAAMSPNRFGFFYAYNYTDIDTKETIGKGHVNDHFFGGYGRFVDGLGYTSFVAGFGFDKYKTRRMVTISAASGESHSEIDGWQGGLYIERGLGRMTSYGLQPYLGLQYLYAETNAFAETGSNPYWLETDAATVNTLRSNLGVRLARQICRVKRGNLYVSGNVSWMHEFLDADCLMTSKWGVANNNPSTFEVRGNSLGRHWALAGAGMDWQLRQNLSLFGSYDLQINGRQMLNVGNVGARMQW
ncbi:MAG: autotransporter domain-containing protein [Planctomycetaceae bacterium]|nr:autotransporter domain-containing protein [Planctomycetaceae bacterium]